MSNECPEIADSFLEMKIHQTFHITKHNVFVALFASITQYEFE